MIINHYQFKTTTQFIFAIRKYNIHVVQNNWRVISSKSNLYVDWIIQNTNTKLNEYGYLDMKIYTCKRWHQFQFTDLAMSHSVRPVYTIYPNIYHQFLNCPRRPKYHKHCDINTTCTFTVKLIMLHGHFSLDEGGGSKFSKL